MSNKSSQLPSEQMAKFERDGFLVLPKLFSQQRVDAISKCIDALVERGPRVGEEMFYYEKSLKDGEQKILSRIEKFFDYDEEMRRLVLGQEELMAAVQATLADEPELFKEKVNFKMPGGAGFEPHQDIQPGWDDYCPYFVSVLVTIDESTVENGCLELSAGHHKKGLLGEKWKPLTEEQLRGIDFELYPMSPGDVAIFDCFVPHQSKPNMTDRQRRNLYLTFNRKNDGMHRLQYFQDKRASYPPDNEREAGKEYSFKV
ncbi:MAG TPA: phytanoyl-CoA dioxygenase family protein [Planktothrix sp.]|jgi:ectoine hydroxylase-related dioxygenase (phytanoyl-CoA dioxygenase family)